MKNFLVVLVTIGLGVAYWYPLPEKAPVAPVARTPLPVAPVRAPFVASHTALDEPAVPVGVRHGTQTSLGGESVNTPR